MLPGDERVRSDSNRFSSKIREDEIQFIGKAHYLVSFIDMIDSTNIASHFNGTEGIRKYYSLFINAVALLARQGGARVIKNDGDCLVIYFPQTLNTGDSASFRQALECCLGICDAHESINAMAKEDGLPPVNYRVSADYGTVELAKLKTSSEYDLIGPTMNLCSKINAMAVPNGVVIGGDLHELLTSHGSSSIGREYRFEQKGEYSAGLKNAYPVYSVTRRTRAFISRVASSEVDKVVHRVMVIDDEPDVLMTFSTMLGSTGTIEVESFTDSLEALRQFLAKNHDYYDLIIADVRMPQINGIQLSRILKSLNHNIRILLVTAHDIVEEVSSMLPEVGKENILSKPLSQEKFIAQVKTAIAK